MRHDPSNALFASRASARREQTVRGAQPSTRHSRCAQRDANDSTNRFTMAQLF